MPFINDNFLLHSDAAEKLYHEYAKNQPILDYHTHLPPADISRNRQFNNLTEIWLEGDHYKWRAMRANGVAETYCTGNADPYEKFLAWARTVPQTLRNPLYNWTHLELKRYFGIEDLLNEETAPSIWEQANEQLKEDRLRPQGIFKEFNVLGVCTTDDPGDSLEDHRAIADSDLETKVLPTFRPDAALRLNNIDEYRPWLEKLSEVSGVSIVNYEGLVAALKSRHDFFHEHGCRLSDHGLEVCYANPCDESTASQIFDRAMQDDPISHEEIEQFSSCLMLHFGRWDAEREWTKQLHLGALRNNNAKLFKTLGRDIGCDSIGDWPQAERLSRYLSLLEQEELLPRTIIYNLNPADNYVFATMIGNFQSGDIAGKVQLGSGWWFLDQWEAMQWQMNALSNQGLLSRFVGMLTDSRSFMSYPRHEYFRRCLSDLLGSEVEKGVLPNDEELLGSMVSNICYHNASNYFRLGV